MKFEQAINRRLSIIREQAPGEDVPEELPPGDPAAMDPAAMDPAEMDPAAEQPMEPVEPPEEAPDIAARRVESNELIRKALLIDRSEISDELWAELSDGEVTNSNIEMKEPMLRDIIAKSIGDGIRVGPKGPGVI